MIAGQKADVKCQPRDESNGQGREAGLEDVVVEEDSLIDAAVVGPVADGLEARLVTGEV